MNTKQLTEKVEQLEKRVEELERRPVFVPYYIPYSPVPPETPPWQPYVGPTCIPTFPSNQQTWINATTKPDIYRP